MRKAKFIYVVWGPSPEWGDGQGVIGYAAFYADAVRILEEEIAYEKQYGPRSWRTIEEVGGIEKVPLEEFLVPSRARKVFQEKGIEGLVDYLNQQI